RNIAYTAAASDKTPGTGVSSASARREPGRGPWPMSERKDPREEASRELALRLATPEGLRLARLLQAAGTLAPPPGPAVPAARGPAGVGGAGAEPDPGT